VRAAPATLNKETPPMLRWSMTFLVIAVVAGILGFGGMAAGAAVLAKLLFLVFVALTIVSFAIHMTERRY
jgi:uncharacterized membrane protein YtjA (UPF0391 family)